MRVEPNHDFVAWLVLMRNACAILSFVVVKDSALFAFLETLPVCHEGDVE
jgi:hypothetical protein